jgi:hypothetical protein
VHIISILSAWKPGLKCITHVRYVEKQLEKEGREKGRLVPALIEVVIYNNTFLP